MSDIKKFIDDFTDSDLDYLQERLADRAEMRHREQVEELERVEAEYEAKKHCQECEKYMSCRERKKNRCDSCGHKQERYR